MRQDQDIRLGSGAACRGRDIRARRRLEADYKAAWPQRKPPTSKPAAAQPMDHDGSDAGGREESRRGRRLRQGGRVGERSRSAGKGSIFQATSEKKLWKDMEIR